MGQSSLDTKIKKRRTKMLEDKTYKVKVGEYCDAVIYVYERHRK